MNFTNDQLRLKTVKELREIIKKNNLAKNYQRLSKLKLIEIIENNQNNFNSNLISKDSDSESESDNNDRQEMSKRYEQAMNLLIDDETDDDLTNFDIAEGKKPKRKLINKKIEKPLKIPEKKYTLSDCKKDVKKLLESHKYSINKLYDKYRRTILDDEDIDDIVNAYNDLRNEIENEINMCIDDLQNEPSNSFYTWVENSLDLHKNKIQNLIS